jgi:hypothetical protein
MFRGSGVSTSDINKCLELIPLGVHSQTADIGPLAFAAYEQTRSHFSSMFKIRASIHFGSNLLRTRSFSSAPAQHLLVEERERFLWVTLSMDE